MTKKKKTIEQFWRDQMKYNNVISLKKNNKKKYLLI